MRSDALSFFLHDMFFWFAIPKETHKIDWPFYGLVFVVLR
jgi:hypothetical protein